MQSKRVRFGVNLDYDDAKNFAKLGGLEKKNPTDFHRAVVRRIVHAWQEKPEQVKELGLVKPEP